MENFTHCIPTEYHFGKGAIDCLGDCLARYGSRGTAPGYFLYMEAAL